MSYEDVLSDDEFNSFIAAQIKKCRKEVKKTQKEVSKGTGYSVSKIKNIENGHTTVDLSTLRTICRFYNKTLDYFFPACKETQIEALDLGEATDAYRSLPREIKKQINQVIITFAKLLGSK